MGHRGGWRDQDRYDGGDVRRVAGGGGRRTLVVVASSDLIAHRASQVLAPRLAMAARRATEGRSAAARITDVRIRSVAGLPEAPPG